MVHPPTCGYWYSWLIFRINVSNTPFLDHMVRMSLQEVSSVRVYDIEPAIRERGRDVKCPKTGKLGSSYVHAIQGANGGGVQQKEFLYHQKRMETKTTYCWWLKSCTTWDVWNPKNNGKNYLSTGAGFRPSTVAPANGDIHHTLEYIGPSTVHKDALFPLNAVIQTLLVQCLVVQVWCHFSLEKSICEQIYLLGIRRQEILTPKNERMSPEKGPFLNFRRNIYLPTINLQGIC